MRIKSGRAQRTKLYHLGIRSTVARNTLANANAVRDGRIYADFAQSLIAKKGFKFPIPNIFSSFYKYGSRVGNIFLLDMHALGRLVTNSLL